MQKQTRVYRVRGHVIVEGTQQGLPGLRVEIWDKDFLFDDFIGCATTGSEGYFDLGFDRAYFDNLFGEQSPDLYFKVYEDGDLVLSTIGDVLWNVEQGDRNVLLVIPRPDSDAEAQPPVTVAVRPEYIHNIREIIARVAGQDTQKAAEMNAHVDQLMKPAAMLSVLLADALDFDRGDGRAAHRFALNLDRLLTSQRAFYTPAQEGASFSVRGLSGHIARPSLPQFRFPCLVLPRLFPQLRFSIDVLMDRLGLDPDLGDVYVEAVGHLFDQLQPLEALHFASQTVRRAQFENLGYFEDVFKSTRAPLGGGEGAWQPTSGEAAGAAGGSGGMFPIPIPGLRPMIDPCAVERWLGTEEASRCFRALMEGPRYEIEDIFNVTRSVSRRGCAGDEVEIRGSHLGSRGKITFGRREAEIIEWSESTIRFRVPESTTADEIGVCIDPGVPICVGLPNACRLASPGTDHSFEFVHAPQISTFEYLGATVSSTGEGSYRAEACVGHEIHAAAAHAERATVTNRAGEIIWDSDEGPPRHVDTRAESPALAVRLLEDEEFTFTVTNLCGTIERVITVDIRHLIHVDGPERVQAGETVEIEVRVSCEAGPEGLPLTVTSSAPASVVPPGDPVVIAAGDNSIRILISGSMPCSDAELTIEAPGHDAATKEIYAFDAPHITHVSPASVDACSNFTLEVRGDCFDPVGVNQVQLSYSDGVTTYGRTARVTSVRFLDSANRLSQATLEADVNQITPPGNYRIRVRAHGLQSEWFDGVLVRAVSAVIHDFRSSIRFIYPCIENRATLTWDVERTERIEIRGPEGTVASESRGSGCSRWSGSAEVVLNTAGTIELRAFPRGGGSPATRTVHLSPVSVLQGSEITVLNNTGPTARFRYSHDLTVWVVNYTRGTVNRDGVIEPGEDTTISLADCNVYGIFCVSHRWVLNHNRTFGTTFDPDDPTILLYSQFHKFWVWVLGRDGAPPLYYTITPGEGIEFFGERPPAEMP